MIVRHMRKSARMTIAGIAAVTLLSDIASAEENPSAPLDPQCVALYQEIFEQFTKGETPPKDKVDWAIALEADVKEGKPCTPYKTPSELSEERKIVANSGPTPQGRMMIWLENPQYRSVETDVTVIALLNIDTLGRVSNCTLQQKSDFESVNAEICDLLIKNAQFTPAGDKDGNAVPGIFTATIPLKIMLLWELK